MTRKKKPVLSKTARIALIVVAVLIAVRAALPSGIEWWVNRVLNENPEYAGTIGDVDMHFWRGAYSIEGIKIYKNGFDPESADQASIKVGRVDLALSWADLLKGQLVTRVRIDHPRLNIVDLKDRKPPGEVKEEVKSKGARLDQTFKRLAPFKVNRLTVNDGEIYFRNPKTQPPVELAVSDLNVELDNLTNARKAEDRLFARLKASAVTTGDGKAEINMVLNPTAQQLTFDLNASLKGLQLKALNSFLKTYGNFDFEAGQGDIVAEVAAADGKIKGYVKPLFKDIKVLSIAKEVERDKDSIFSVAWEAIVGGATQLFSNWPKDQLATRIPIEGKISDPEISPWTVVGNVLRNAFVTAFTPFYDRTISLKTTQAAPERKP